MRPTIYLGVTGSAMETRGICTERGDINREVIITNRELRTLATRIQKAKNKLYAFLVTDMPTIVDTMKAVGGGKNLVYRPQKIFKFKTQVKLLVFLQES